MKRVLAVLTLALIMTSVLAIAQPNTPSADEPLPRYGIAGHAGLNFHSADFRALPGFPNCCQQFESGSGFGWDLGLLYEFPFSAQWWLGLRGGYSSQGATLRASEPTTVILFNRDPRTDSLVASPVSGEFEHSIAASIGTIGLEPMIGFRPIERLSIYAGGRIGFLMQRAFDQKEEIVQPEDRGTFENGQRVRNVFSGDIPEASTIEGALVFGAGMEFPLNREGTVLLAPEVFATIGLTNLQSDSAWRANSLRLGAALKFAPKPVAEQPPPPPPPVQPPAQPPLLVANVSAVGVEHDGSEREAFRLSVEEFIATSMRPLLPYIFFEPNSAEIPSRYRMISAGDAAAFQMENLHDVQTLPTYYQILNIIGKRMRDNPGTTIRLVGTNADTAAEKGNLELSRARAESVHKYLRDVWGIEANRMKVESRNLPEKPSNRAELDGEQENRRVEILASDWRIIEPIVTNDTVRTANPPVIRFRPDVNSAAGVTGWRLAATQEGRLLKEFAGTGAVPHDLSWNVDDDRDAMPRIPTPIEYSLQVTDAAGQTVRTPAGSLPVEQVTIQRKREERLADKQIDRYSLILFDFDRSDLNEANLRIARWVKDRVRPEATVTVVGSTDRTGDAAYNLRLSEDRARNVARTLGVGGTVKGIGESDLYDNDLPEGRFYCRTVSIVAETPVR